MRKKLFLFLALTLFFNGLENHFPPAFAEDVYPLSLSGALQIAQKQNVDVIVSNERVQQAITRIRQARAPLLPQLSGAVSQYRQTLNLATFGIDFPFLFSPFVGPFNVFDARISLTQTLFDYSVIERLRAAKVGQQLSVAEAQKTRQDVLALVANLWLDAKRAQDKVRLSQALVQQDEERLKIARSQLQLGIGTDLGVTQLEASLADSRSRLSESTTDAVERRLDLTSALGMNAEKKISFQNDAKLNLPKAPQKEITFYLLEHPEVLVAEKDLEEKRKERKAALAEYFPTIVGSANYGASGNSPGQNDEGTYAYGAKLSIPLYEGGLRRAKVQEAKSKIRASEAQVTDTKKRTESKILSAEESLKKATAMVKAAEAELIFSQKQFSIAQGRLHSGIGTSLELTETRTQKVMAEDRANEALATYQLAQVNLAHALGEIGQLIPAKEESGK